MYSRGFDSELPYEQPTEEVYAEPKKKGILGKLDTEDLLLIGVALLLLSDGNGENDTLALILIALLLF